MHRDLLSQRVKQRLVFQLGTRSSGAQQARFELGFQLGGQDPESRWALELGLGLEFEFVQDSEALGAPGLGLGVELGGQDSEATGAPCQGPCPRPGGRSLVLHPRKNPGRAWACGPGGPCSCLFWSLGNASGQIMILVVSGGLSTR